MKRRGNTAALLMALCLFICLLGGCTTTVPVETPVAPVQSPAPAVTPPPDVLPDEVPTVEYASFSGIFSPFFASSEGDTAVSDMTQVKLKDAAELDVTEAEDGNVTYRIKLRDDIRFSDGKYADIDDLIFTLYVFFDPAYDGAVSLDNCGIVGLKEYRTQSSEALYDKYSDIFNDAYAGENDYAASAREFVKKAWIADVSAIVDYCCRNYIDSAEVYTGHPAAEITTEGMQVMFAMVTWSYGDIDANGNLVSMSGKQWNLSTSFPTLEDFYNEFVDVYDGDCVKYWRYEGVDDTDVYAEAKNAFIQYWAARETGNENGISRVTGMKRVDDYTLEITASEYSKEAESVIGSIPAAPLDDDGDESLYDYEADSFGFRRGELEAVREKNAAPVGAGPYRFTGFENGTVEFALNEYYFGQAPENEHVRFVDKTAK